MAVHRILHLRTVTGSGGGPEKTILNSPRYLQDGFQMKVAYLRPTNDPDYDVAEKAADLGIDFVDIPENGPFDIRTIGRLVKLVLDYRPHVIHAHDYKTNALVVLLRILVKTKIVTTVHGYVVRGGRLEIYYKIDSLALRRMDHIVVVSPDLYTRVRSLGISAARISLIENGIDTDRYTRQKTIECAKRNIDIDSSMFLIGAVGRLSPEKGFDILIRCVGALIREGLDVGLVIVGEGDDRCRLEEIIAELNIQDRVRLVGYQREPGRFFEAMDVFVLSSLREGLPNVVLEAMAFQAPVIATRIAGVPRVIVDGVNGLLVEPGSESDLIEKLMRLYRAPSLREQFGKRGRSTTVRDFSFAKRMEKMRAVYEEIIV